ncbi:hypothetical protein HDU98_001283 [Podochytrium sp. JEL0797]|nr:hypothetical protein HDU98_001283 [Podochytrium sp. JEL0797]
MADLGFFAPAGADVDEAEMVLDASSIETEPEQTALAMDLDSFLPSDSASSTKDALGLAKKTWLTKTPKQLAQKVVSELCENLQDDHVYAAQLDALQCLEKYLWPLFPKSNATTSHVLAIAALVNEKRRANSSANPWHLVAENKDRFVTLFKQILALLVSNDLPINQRTTALLFIANAFQALEVNVVRAECMKLVGISVWHSLRDAEKLEIELNKAPELRKVWNKAEKKHANASDEDITNEQYFLSNLIKLYYKILATLSRDPTASDLPALSFCERTVEFFTDLLTQLPTRRYLCVLLQDHYLSQTSHRSALAARGSAHLQTGASMPHRLSGTTFVQLLVLLDTYLDFEIDNVTGASVTRDDGVRMHYDKLQGLQKLCFGEAAYRGAGLEDFALQPVSVVETPEAFRKYFGGVAEAVVKSVCVELGFRVDVVGGEKEGEEGAVEYDVDFLVDALCRVYCKKTRQLDLVNMVSVYPNEVDLFDDTRSPTTRTFQNTHPLAIPKLNLQFLTMHDYLLRNFNLYRLEAAYEIRQDIEDAVKRLAPKYTPDVDSLSGSTVFTGWARMAVPIDRFEVTEVGTPTLGSLTPSSVVGELSFSIGRYTDTIRREWESLKRHDVLFLVTLEMDAEMPSWATTNGSGDAKKKLAGKNSHLPFRKQFGVKHVRGCMVVDVLDHKGNAAEAKQATGRASTRTLRVSLDANQYTLDMAPVVKKEGTDLHKSFNILVRRKGAENNFKSVVESVRDVMQSSDIVVPDWLQDVVLGYGDPRGAGWREMKEPVVRIDFRDTFLGWKHLEESFPGMTLKPVGDLASAEDNAKSPPFVLTFPNSMYTELKDAESSSLGKRKHGKKQAAVEEEKVVEVQVETYKPLNMGPFLEDVPRKNAIRFTPKQVEAIHAGSSPGLTLVVGPPGTGKTDTTVQIIANIYHNFPQEKTLLITHSNQALNHLFEKIVALDIDARHVLRLGQGAEDIDSEESWGKYGRVNSFLEKRIALLAQVDVLAASLQLERGAYGSTCETAQHFYGQHVVRLWERYREVAVDVEGVTVQQLADEFPFHYYFSGAPSPLFYEGQTVENARDVVEGCFRHIEKMFTELEEVRAFELLRNNHDRSNYLLIKEAKIVALTCTHAALKRRDLVALGFQYHNVVMEEAAQVLEVEALLPLLLQSADPGTGLSRLKRVVMVGDHHQLPPIVQSAAVQQYANLEQSLFARLIRLGVPAIELDRQGRCRAQLADLFRWKYAGLKDLEVVGQRQEFLVANPGFSFESQFVNVGDLNGKGETEPIPHFLQNVAEAEYVVATFQYMRLLGYPAEKISILTTYNGQKSLIEDVLEKRCRWNPLFGLPHKVSTVDKFQGQQNDYILLSLVRTKQVGHLRDVRRLIVALSRARLGLYVFGRWELFAGCKELEDAFELFGKKPTEGFWLRGQEMWEGEEGERLVEETGVVGDGKKGWKAEDEDKVFEIKDVVHMGSYVHQMIVEQVEFLKTQKATVSQDMDVVEEIDE